jgi:hypothetical protein
MFRHGHIIRFGFLLLFEISFLCGSLASVGLAKRMP